MILYSMDVQVTTATLFGTSSVTFYVDAGGFAPRHLSRSVASSGLGSRVILPNRRSNYANSNYKY